MNVGSLYKAIYAKLTGNSTVSTAFSDRIYSDRARDDGNGDPTYPYLVFWAVDTVRDGLFGGKDHETADMQFDVYTDSQSVVALSTLMSAVKGAMDATSLSYSGSSSDYASIMVRRTREHVFQEDQVYHGIIEYEVHAQETA